MAGISFGRHRLLIPEGWPWALAVAAIIITGGANWTIPAGRLIGGAIGACLLIIAFVLPAARSDLRWCLVDKLWLALGALFILHLVPLPPLIWTALPGREVAAAVDSTLSGTPGWRPFTLDVQASLQAALALVPALAIYCAARRGGTARQQQMLGGVALAVVVALFIGLLQMAFAGADWLRFYPVGDYDFAIGFFTNRNHHADFLVSALPLVAAFLLMHRAALTDPAGSPPLGWILTALALLIALAVLASSSRTGAALMPFAFAATALAWWSAPGRRSSLGLTPLRALLKANWRRLAIAAALAAGLVALIALMGGDRVGAVLRRGDIASDQRFDFWPHVISAAMHYWPLGSGLGTFIEGYEMFEPVEALGVLYLNHAHNEYFEILLEAGVPGLVLALVASWELSLSAMRAWRDGVALPQRRLAAIALALPIAHSLVDYPLRTLAISGLAALAAAMLMEADSA